jgi:nucleotide-binding universal stress UspA family protein
MLALVPVLDSVNALPAVRYVIREAMAGERYEVRLLDVRSWRGASDNLTGARALLDQFGIRHTTQVRTGDKAQAVISSALWPGADLIVLGTARYRSATRLAEDAVVQKLLDHAPVALVVVAGKEVSRLERYGVAAGLGTMVGLLALAA